MRVVVLGLLGHLQAFPSRVGEHNSPCSQEAASSKFNDCRSEAPPPPISYELQMQEDRVMYPDTLRRVVDEFCIDMDEVVGCLVDSAQNMEYSISCDKIAVLAIQLTTDLIYANFGVRPSAEALESLACYPNFLWKLSAFQATRSPQLCVEEVYFLLAAMATFSVLSEPPIAGEFSPDDTVMTQAIIRRVIDEYCMYTVAGTRRCFAERIEEENCPSRDQLIRTAENTGGLCEGNHTASWMEDYILPHVETVDFSECDVTGPIDLCRYKRSTTYRRPSSAQEMDDEIACLVQNMVDSDDPNCKMGVLAVQLTMVTLYSNYGVAPTTEALESLACLAQSRTTRGLSFASSADPRFSVTEVEIPLLAAIATDQNARMWFTPGEAQARFG
ncbi:hypothetical protein BaRGS_00035592, partial [Batillaria attramentaria]